MGQTYRDYHLEIIILVYDLCCIHCVALPEQTFREVLAKMPVKISGAIWQRHLNEPHESVVHILTHSVCTDVLLLP